MLGKTSRWLGQRMGSDIMETNTQIKKLNWCYNLEKIFWKLLFARRDSESFGVLCRDKNALLYNYVLLHLTLSLFGYFIFAIPPKITFRAIFGGFLQYPQNIYKIVDYRQKSGPKPKIPGYGGHFEKFSDGRRHIHNFFKKSYFIFLQTS